jgi:hypothetical protein
MTNEEIEQSNKDTAEKSAAIVRILANMTVSSAQALLELVSGDLPYIGLIPDRNVSID